MKIDGIEIYKSPDGNTEVEVKFEDETIWLTQLQMADLFDKDIRTINEHIKNIYNSGELEKSSTIRKFRIVRKEGKRRVTRNIDHYNLDIIISVGYRVNSVKGTQFRQWATRRLKEYLIQGYTINEKRLKQKQREIKYLKTGIQILNRAIEEKASSEVTYEWLQQFSKGLELLDDYDYENLDKSGLTKQKVKLPAISDYRKLIEEMKKGVDSRIFGKEKDKSFHSSINQISKGFDDKDFYPSMEEKAATLLYLIIKNHSFVDGNKRIAAACFLLFLERNNMLRNKEGEPIISNEALASLTLFIAASRPEEMNTVKKLVISILNRNRT
jgi:death-on-curing family protein